MCLVLPGRLESLDPVVEGDQVEVVAGEVLGGIAADHGRFTSPLDLKRQRLPQLDACLGVLECGGDRERERGGDSRGGDREQGGRVLGAGDRV